MRLTDLPARAGAGFKPEHFAAISAGPQPVAFFEVHAENYMGEGGLPHAHLRFLREHHALSLHGVGLNIAAETELDRAHLARLKRLCDLYRPESFSEHLAWSSHAGIYFNDLLPLPYTRSTLSTVIDHVVATQQLLGRRILIENPATYVQFDRSDIPETDFLWEIAKATGCGLLLDINNVFVAGQNHGFDPSAYLKNFPLELAGEIHLAGHFETRDEQGARLLIDAHDSAVKATVFDLYDSVIARTGPLPTLIEWDNEVPEWPVLRAEVCAAQAKLDQRPAARRGASAAA
ncbi:MAG TPA: DUF692 domain-containing protein [Methylocella sp.]|nr:DUF692 domain-containing protein [Methylocella sp.]